MKRIIRRSIIPFILIFIIGYKFYLTNPYRFISTTDIIKVKVNNTLIDDGIKSDLIKGLRESKLIDNESYVGTAEYVMILYLSDGKELSILPHDTKTTVTITKRKNNKLLKCRNYYSPRLAEWLETLSKSK